MKQAAREGRADYNVMTGASAALRLLDLWAFASVGRVVVSTPLCRGVRLTHASQHTLTVLHTIT